MMQDDAGRFDRFFKAAEAARDAEPFQIPDPKPDPMGRRMVSQPVVSEDDLAARQTLLLVTWLSAHAELWETVSREMPASGPLDTTMLGWTVRMLEWQHQRIGELETEVAELEGEIAEHEFGNVEGETK